MKTVTLKIECDENNHSVEIKHHFSSAAPWDLIAEECGHDDAMLKNALIGMGYKITDKAWKGDA